MSKDFEQAYRELAQNEIPDLWDRIEAGIQEKSTPEKEISKHKTVKRRYFKWYTTTAAAVACAVLIVPAAVFLGYLENGKGGAMEMAEEAAEDTTAAGVETATAKSEETSAAQEDIPAKSEEAAPELEDTAAKLEEAAAEQKNGIKELAYAKGAEKESGAGIEEMADTSAADAENRSMASEKTENMRLESAEEESLKQDMGEELEDGAVLKNITVEIIGEVSEYGNDMASSGNIYTAIVRKDAQGYFLEGEQITIFVPVYSSTALFENAVFEVDLVYKKMEKYSFQLQKP